MSDDRHSFTERKEQIADPIERARREVENGIRQFNAMADIIRRYVKTGRKFVLRLGDILRLQSVALEGIDILAGTFRNTPIIIKGSRHSPPDQFEVAEEVAGLCKYVNEHWDDRTPIHLASYVLWKLNWIHPFADGNGRTARTVSYVVLCLKLDGLLPGAPTIPEQIAANKGPYYDALEAADQAAAEGRIDVSSLENMLSSMLAKQLLSIAVFSETAEDKIKAIIENRVRNANAESIITLYGVANPEGRTWQINLDHIAFQVASSEEIRAAVERNTKYRSPFPNLLNTAHSGHRRREVGRDEDGTILVDHVFHDTTGKGVLSLREDVSVGLLNPEVTTTDGLSWKLRGSLYVIRYGVMVSAENVYDILDLLITKHLRSA
jgi:hypothetical protein